MIIYDTIPPRTKDIYISNMHQNIIGFAIAENSLLEEFNYAIKDFDPLYSKKEPYKNNKRLKIRLLWITILKKKWNAQ